MTIQDRNHWVERTDHMRAKEREPDTPFSSGFDTKPPTSPSQGLRTTGPSPGQAVLARRRRQRLLAWCGGAVALVMTAALLFQLFQLFRR
ncbi:MAG: hypothetical protein V4792_05010 [Pseudomonadota bacterium]